jgi:hypothetical protein
VEIAVTFPLAAPPKCEGPLVADFVVRSMRFALFALVSLGLSGHMLAQNEFPTDEVVETNTVYWLPDSLSIKVAKRFGIADAQRDIKAGIFRRYVYDDGRLATALLMFDPKTGYRVNRVIESYGRKPSDSFMAWLQAYNQVMRKWHDSHD